jgi:tetratricopeptide (TPR) repeat protein
VGILEVPSDAKLPAGEWRGRVETEPVTLKILPQQAQRSTAEKTESELEYVNYFLATNQAAKALQHAQEALAASPASIDAYIAVGDSKNMQGDAQGALDAYEAALTAFYDRENLPYEPPSLLTHKISMLEEKLAKKP